MSLQAQLVWRLCLVLVASLVLVVAMFVAVTWVTLDEVEDVDDVSLYSLAQQVTGTIRRDGEAEGPSYEALITRPIGEADLTLFVARRTEFEPESQIEEFAETFVWILPPIMIVALLIAILTIRGAMSPLKALSERAAVIGPGTINIRLPLEGVAKEILPLVAAVNGALERLDWGYHAQRKFAADAAHELRTPLAVLTARLIELPDSSTRKDLQDDAHRLERLVSQLLTVARAEGKVLDLDQIVDLYAKAAEVVAFMAPSPLSGAGRLR
jgi:signal transduction histidine kinase